MEFGKRIKEVRVKLGYSQQEVAKILFVTRQTVSNWELGKSYPNLELLASLSDLYEVSVDDLLKEDEKLLQYSVNNPRATRKQKIWSFLVADLGCLYMIVEDISSIIRGPRTPTKWILFGWSMLMLGVMEIISIVALVRNTRRKENSLTRMKRLKSPAHHLENIRIFIVGVSSVMGISGLIALHYDHLIVSVLCNIAMFSTVPFHVHYSKKIRQVLNLPSIWEE